MIQKEFAHRARVILEPDDAVIGLAAAGSWVTNELDEFSDLDLILVTKQKVSDNKELMFAYANRLGNLLSGFTGEHVGEPRVLICLYDNPLLHVDIKFVTLDEFRTRVDTPAILLDKDGRLQKVIDGSTAAYPHPEYQWIEDRFWIWVHYALLKIGRGELFEAYDFMSFLRLVVFGPLLHIKNGQLPRGVRKVEAALSLTDLKKLKLTLTNCDKQSLLTGLKQSVVLYRELQADLYGNQIQLQKETESKVMDYFSEIEYGK